MPRLDFLSNSANVPQNSMTSVKLPFLLQSQSGIRTRKTHKESMGSMLSAFLFENEFAALCPSVLALMVEKDMRA